MADPKPPRSGHADQEPLQCRPGTTCSPCGNWHGVARDFARRSSFNDEFEKKDNAIWNADVDDRNKLGLDETYAEYGQYGLEERDAQFDVLVVDEAQDVLWSPHVRGFLDAALRGGLAGSPLPAPARLTGSDGRGRPAG